MRDLTLSKKIFDACFSSVDGYVVSRNARRKLNYTDKTLVYGEILFDTFIQILTEVNPKPGEVFYDLGSGIGKAVIAAALLFPFSKAIGIELLTDINNAANEILARFNNDFKHLLPLEKHHQIIKFIQGNFLEYDFSDGDVIFFHATCFPDELMLTFSRKLENLKKGTRVIVATKVITSDKFKLFKKQDYQMGWGRATVNFYDKIA